MLTLNMVSPKYHRYTVYFTDEKGAQQTRYYLANSEEEAKADFIKDFPKYKNSVKKVEYSGRIIY